MSEHAKKTHDPGEIGECERIIRDLERERDLSRQREERYKAILEGIEDGYYEVDLKGQAIFFNTSYLGILGYSAEEMTGKHYTEYVSEETGRIIFKTFNQVFKTGQPTKALEWPLIRKDGTTCHVQISISLIRNLKGDPTGFRGVMRDITPMIRAKEELRQAKIKAEEASVAKSEFMANISHEIRTPLNAIIGFGDILMGTELPQEQRGYAEAIHLNSSVLLGLIDDILHFSESGPEIVVNKAMDFDLKPVICDVVEKYRPQITSRPIALTCRIGDIPSSVHGSPDTVTQIVTILMENASKFTDRGEICVFVDGTRRDETSVDIHLNIRDTGIGMTEDQLALAFEPFRQADGSSTRKYGGVGLGLSLCKKLLDSLNGSIRMESTQGSGTLVHITLPMAVSSASGPVWPDLRHGAGKTVLLVDDNPVNRKMLSLILVHEGYGVDMAENGRDAVDRVVQNLQRYDLVLMDVQMPVLNGLEATRAIRKQGVDTPIIALTASVLGSDMDECLAAGMNDYATKPVRRENISKILHKWCF